jgi:signal transduction histidine kinase/AraC-like DNA-binding protein/sugar lactone lactonase YvrE
MRYEAAKINLPAYRGTAYFDATSICRSSGGPLWVATPAGFIHRYEAPADSFTRYNVFDKSPAVASNWIEKIYDTGKGSLLIGTSNQGVKRFDCRTATYEDILTRNADKTEIFARDFIHHSGDVYWMATESGLFLYDLGRNTFENLQKDYRNPYAISDNAIYTLCKDKEGGIWAGTYFGGVNYAPNPYTPFEKFLPHYGPNALSGHAVREICRDRLGNLWIGTEDAGLNKRDARTGLITHFNPTGDKTGIAYSNIHGLLPVGDELWVGTFEHGLDVLDIKTGKVLRHYTSGTGPNAFKSNFISALYRTRTGTIFLGTARGLYRFQPATNDFARLGELPDQAFVHALLEDREGTLWVATMEDGLYSYNAGTRLSSHFTYDAASKSSLSSNTVNSLFEDSNGQLWCATEGGGLCKLNPDRKGFTRYATRHGLPSNTVFNLLEDGQRNLWISTAKGLVRLNPATGKVCVYTRDNGLLSEQFNYNSAYKDPQGRMYFGSLNGLIRFHPDQFRPNTFTPPVYLTGFQVNNGEVAVGKEDSPLRKSITGTREITLSSQQASFSIDFAAPCYTAPATTQYAYQLEGLEGDWVSLHANRKVYYTQLSPGTYVFKVKAANSSGVWSKQETRLTIHILPPFWRSTWAYFLYAATGLGLGYLAVRNYHRRTREKNSQKYERLEREKEKEVYQAKIEFFTHVAHEIRSPLTLIAGPLEKVMKQMDDFPALRDNLKIMEKNTGRLLDLTNQLLDFRKTEAKGFSLSFVKADVTKLLRENVSRFSPVAESRNLNVQVSLPISPLYAYLDPEAFNKILSNLLSNAVKYAKIQVHVELSPPGKGKDGERFTLVVKNDGYLIPHELREKIFEPFFQIEGAEKQPGTGIGLPLARSLTELHKGTLTLDKPENDLNCFSLSLPVHQEQEFDLYREPPAETQPGSAPPEPGHAKPVLLLVEDNREILEFLQSELATDYTLIKTFDGQQALEVLQKEAVHLVVSDVVMPVMGGLDLCRSIKTSPVYSHIPVVLLTAKTTLHHKIEGLELGADAYLEKPFSPEHLHVQISNLLANRLKIKEHFAGSPLVHLKNPAYSKADETFLEKLNEAIYQYMVDPELDVDRLAGSMNMSRPTFYRKIKAVSNLTPNELVNNARLQVAAQLLAEGGYKIYEISERVGYKSATHFGRNFIKHFGMSPSEYALSKRVVKTE